MFTLKHSAQVDSPPGYGITAANAQTVKGNNEAWHNFFNVFQYSSLKLNVMLRWTVIFLIIAIIAGAFGFFGIAAGAASIAKVLFFIFIVLFLISLIGGRRWGRTSDPL